MSAPQQPQPTPSRRRRVPWFLIIAAAVIIVGGILIAVLARGQAVEDVSRGAQPAPTSISAPAFASPGTPTSRG